MEFYTLRTLAPDISRCRTTSACLVNTAKWIGAWASSFFKSNSHGCGAKRISQITFGISLIIARCNALFSHLEKETRKYWNVNESSIVWNFSSIACKLKHETNRTKKTTPNKFKYQSIYQQLHVFFPGRCCCFSSFIFEICLFGIETHREHNHLRITVVILSIEFFPWNLGQFLMRFIWFGCGEIFWWIYA